MIAAVLAAGAASIVPPRCHTADLAATLRRGSPGAGQRYATLVLRNRSAHRCTVFGYVGAQLVGVSGRPLPTRIVRDRTRVPRRVTLAPGRRATALLHWAAIPGPGEPQRAPCEPTPRAIRITPPDETTQLTLRWRFGVVCERGRIEVRPLRRADAGATRPARGRVT
jgi:hypothetical protein